MGHHQYGILWSQHVLCATGGDTAEGDDLQIPWEQAQVKAAPQVDDDGHLTPEEEVQLYRHYAKEQRLAPDADDVGRKETPDGNGGTERGRPGRGETRISRDGTSPPEEIRRDRKGATRIAGAIGRLAGRRSPGAIEWSLVEPWSDSPEIIRVKSTFGGPMIIVGVLLIVAGAAFGIDVAVKNRFPVSDLEVFGSTLGFHHAEQIFLFGPVTGVVILLGLVLITAGTVRRRSRNGAYRRQPRGLAENDQRRGGSQPEPEAEANGRRSLSYSRRGCARDKCGRLNGRQCRRKPAISCGRWLNRLDQGV